MPDEQQTEQCLMSSDGQDNSNSPAGDTAAGSDKQLDDSPLPSFDLNSEALAHLQVLCEQIDVHARAFAGDADQQRQDQLLEDLGRFRNTLVLLDKPALEFVVREIILMVDGCLTAPAHDTAVVAEVLGAAAVQLCDHLRLMQIDVSLDGALSMVTLVNDCRACREDMLLSDALMLAAEIPVAFVPEPSVSNAMWARQRRLWVDYAKVHGASLSQKVADCCSAQEAGSSEPLIQKLEAFTDFTSRHIYLQSLVPVFQCAMLLAPEFENKNQICGPGLRSLFVQLERTIHRCELVATAADLFPADLLRNLLFYVAQLDGNKSEISGLARRFRLDRVRHAAASVRCTDTPTIGVEYHLTNAIRSGITHETEPLRAWLDQPSGEHDYPNVVRMRVRLAQLESVLAIIGAAQALACLKSINAQLQGFRSHAPVTQNQRLELADSFLQLDGLLDQSARRSVMRSKPTDAARLSGGDVYLDMATDACLREARSELQVVIDHLAFLQIQHDQYAQLGEHMSRRLTAVNHALQILPLPEVAPLLADVAMAVKQLFSDAQTSAGVRDQSESDVGTGSVIEQAQKHVQKLLEAIDDYLGCVLLPQPVASQILADAEDTLDQLRTLLAQSAQQAQQASNEPQHHAPANHSVVSKAMDRQVILVDATDADDALKTQSPDEQNALFLPDTESLTLDVDDDLLLDTFSQGTPPSKERTLHLVFEQECRGHLESLDESISRALRPSTSQESYLPNEQMLRALHTLTESAQVINATDVTAIVQPLQRTALELHRQGRHFSAAQTRYIADLVNVIRARLDHGNGSTLFSEQIIRTESRLAEFVSEVLPGMGGRSVSESPLLVEAKQRESQSNKPDLVEDTSQATDSILGEVTDLTVKQARHAEHFARLKQIHEDIERWSSRWQELRRSGQIPDTPAVVNLFANMETSRVQLQDALRNGEQSQFQLAQAGADLQQALVRTRLGRFKELSASLDETIQDLAEKRNASVSLAMTGEDLPIERSILSQLAAPLEKLARNSIVHGIETPKQRIAARKPAVGVVSIDASVDGTELVLVFQDDGRGISPLLRERLGLRDKYTGTVSDKQLKEILFQSTFTRDEPVDATVGPGYGLAAVKAAVDKMQGRVCMEAATDNGFCVTFRIPQKLVVQQVVLVKVQDRYYGLPVRNVSTVSVDGDTLSTETPLEPPQLSLRELVGSIGPSPSGPPDSTSSRLDKKPASVLVCISDRYTSITVDHVVGYRELVTQPLGRQLDSLGRFSSGGVLSNGQQVLILDLANLMSTQRSISVNEAKNQNVVKPVRPLAMVVGDSLTVRLKLHDMLSTSGIDVHVCKDGLSALDSLETGFPDILFVDLEMPRFDGLAMLRELAKRYPDFAAPIILLTERTDALAKRAAIECGATCFLAKPCSEMQLRAAMKEAGMRLPDFTIA